MGLTAAQRAEISAAIVMAAQHVTDLQGATLSSVPGILISVEDAELYAEVLLDGDPDGNTVPCQLCADLQAGDRVLILAAVGGGAYALPLGPPGIRSAPVLVQTVISTGASIGGTETTIATLTVPAQNSPATVECAAYWSASNSVASDTFIFKVKVDGVTVATEDRTFAGTTDRKPFNPPTSLFQPTVPETPVDVTVTVQRTAGTGVLTQHASGLLTARLYF